MLFHFLFFLYPNLVKNLQPNCEKVHLFSFYTIIINGFTYFLVPAAILIIGRTGNYAAVITNMFFYILITPLISSNIIKIMHLN